jgi:hypothetical protein
MAGNLSVETCGNVFAPAARKASSNYGIGTDGRVGMYVEEHNRAWTTSDRGNDYSAVTIEVANDEIGGSWHVSDKAMASLLELCADICRRNGIAKLVYTGNKGGTLTIHKWFAATNCPGPFLESRMPYIAQEVTRRLQPEEIKPKATYYVQTGAYSVKDNADAQLAKVKTAGFDAIIKLSGKLFRVQVGAYTVKANADNMAKRLHTAGFEAVVTIEGGTVVSVNPESAFLPGDVNGNGKLDADDARMAQRAAAKLETLTEEQLKAADMNGDGKITAADPREILRKSAKLE